MENFENENVPKTHSFITSRRFLSTGSRIFWIWAGLAFSPASAETADTTVQFVEQSPVYFINEDYLLRLNNDSSGTGDSIFLFQGTETGTRPAKHPQKPVKAVGIKRYTPKPNSSSATPGQWLKFFGNGNRMLEFLAWEKGLDIHYEYLRLLRSWPNWVIRSRFKTSYMTGNKWFVAGGSWMFTGYSGPLSDSLQHLYRESFQGFGWSLSVGIPGIRYELMASPWVLPDYSFLEKRVIATIDSGSSGRVIRQYEDPDELRSFPLNKAQHFEMKWGVFRYNLLLDPDVYWGPVHDIKLTGLPVIIGEWGMGIAGAEGVWVPGAWLRLGDLDFSLSHWFKRPLNVRISFLQAELRFHELNDFHLGINWNIHVTDPFAHRWESN